MAVPSSRLLRSGAGVAAATLLGLKRWKGNLHSHTRWSDGDGFPDMVATWYRDHGYHFLALSEHNV